MKLKSPEKQRYFHAREKCRDAFLHLLHHGVGNEAGLHYNVWKFIKEISPDLYPWFASLFLQQLLLDCSNRDEFDPTLRRFATPGKLRNLSLRMRRGGKKGGDIMFHVCSFFPQLDNLEICYFRRSSLLRAKPFFIIFFASQITIVSISIFSLRLKVKY